MGECTPNFLTIFFHAAIPTNLSPHTSSFTLNFHRSKKEQRKEMGMGVEVILVDSGGPRKQMIR